MATLAQMRTAIDTFLAGKWPSIIARQDTFHAVHGRYWQGLRTHTAPPAHTNGSDGGAVADRLASSPTDESSRWLDAFPLWVADVFPARVWIDIYDGPTGKGYVAGIEATHNGVTWRRTQNVGPESFRTQGWHQVGAL